MKDPYVYEGSNTLKNKFNILDQEVLDKIENDIVQIAIIRTKDTLKCSDENISFQYLMDIHRSLFSKIYEWAGEPRVINISKREEVLGGGSVFYTSTDLIEKEMNEALNSLNKVKWDNLTHEQLVKEFSSKISEVWRVHPFREGNTRTTMLFASLFAEQKGFPLEVQLFKDNSKYLRDSLVMASIGQYSELQHLELIIGDSIKEGKKQIQQDRVSIKDRIKKAKEQSKEHKNKKNNKYKDIER